MINEMPKQDDRIHYLYRVTCLLNNKVYIGQTVDPATRWKSHQRDAVDPEFPFHYAIKKYGFNNFEFEVIACCKGFDNANFLETELVSQYDSFVKNGKGYNATLGGFNAPRTEVFKKLMRDHWADPEWRENTIQSITQTHANHTPKEKEYTSKLISEKLIGRHLSPDTEFQLNYIMEEEIKNKISEANAGKHNSPETEFKPGHQIQWKPTPEEKEDWINKLSNANKGKHYSPATEIKSGQHASIKTEFKPGQIPWNKGLHNTNTGGFVAGSQHPNAKLTEKQVLEILNLYTSIKNKTHIAKLLGINKELVYAVLSGKSWSHITGINKKSSSI